MSTQVKQAAPTNGPIYLPIYPVYYPWPVPCADDDGTHNKTTGTKPTLPPTQNHPQLTPPHPASTIVQPTTNTFHPASIKPTGGAATELPTAVQPVPAAAAVAAPVPAAAAVAAPVPAAVAAPVPAAVAVPAAAAAVQLAPVVSSPAVPEPAVVDPDPTPVDDKKPKRRSRIVFWVVIIVSIVVVVLIIIIAVLTGKKTGGTSATATTTQGSTSLAASNVITIPSSGINQQVLAQIAAANPSASAQIFSPPGGVVWTPANAACTAQTLGGYLTAARISSSATLDPACADDLANYMVTQAGPLYTSTTGCSGQDLDAYLKWVTGGQTATVGAPGIGSCTTSDFARYVDDFYYWRGDTTSGGPVQQLSINSMAGGFNTGAYIAGMGGGTMYA